MNQQLIVFTVHKAASLGVHEVLRIAKREKWDFYSPNLKTPNITEPSSVGDEAFHEQFKNRTGLFGPIRGPFQMTEEMKQTARCCVHLRDPRDVLVSMYFSWSYSHPGVDEEVRSRYREMGVDRAALFESAQLLEKYQYYLHHLLSLENTALLRYEDFILNRAQWLQQLLNALGIGHHIKHYGRLAKENPAEKITTEDKRRHIRKALPGDFREKLNAETIAQLNRHWADVLKALNYAP